MINPADGMVDEEAESLAFQDAVSEWRTGGSGRVKIEWEGKPTADDGLWRNPFGPADTASDLLILGDNDADDEDMEGVGSVSSSQGKSRGPESQAPYRHGPLDEEAEHQVEQFRNGRIISHY